MALAIFLLAVVLVFWVVYEAEDEAEIQRRSRELEQQLAAGRRGRLPWESRLPAGSISDLMQQIARIAEPTPEAMRAHIEMYYMYPPNSRPLERKMLDLMDPISLQNERLPLVSPADKEKLRKGLLRPSDLEPAEHDIHFWGPKHSIAGNETFILYLEVLERSTGQRVPAVVQSAIVLSDFKTGNRPLNAARFNDRGEAPDEAPDLVTTIAWQPEQNSRLYWGELTMQVTFTVAGKKYIENQVFFSTPFYPAEFTDRFNEYLKDGSLYIEVEVNVRQAGHYIIEANLFHKYSEEPMHWVYFNGELPRGVQRVPLQFFGRIFHEKNREGVFVLKHLRGYRNNINFSLSQLEQVAINPSLADTTRDPDRSSIAGPKRDYETQFYTLDQFSDEFFNSADKEAALADFPNP